MNTTTAINSASLFFRDGSSDKVYHATVEPCGGGFVVNTAWGRRGAVLQTGTKTSTPVPLDKATKLFEKVVSEKEAKGYTAESGGAAFAGTANAGRVSGIAVQLLNEISEAEAEKMILDPAYCLQEKMNGERRAATNDGSEPQGINKKGLFVALPEVIAEGLRSELADSSTVDGEQVGDVLYVFDLLRDCGEDVTRRPLRERLELLKRALASSAAVVRVPAAYDSAAKRTMFNRVKAAKGEGVVFKRLDAPYTAGRPNSGGSQFKFKFKATAQVVVVAQNDKRSVRMAVVDPDGRRVEIGSVTVPPSSGIPLPGAVIEVEYLYAYRGGALFQPVLLGERRDIDESDCTFGQLKFKPE